MRNKKCYNNLAFKRRRFIFFYPIYLISVHTYKRIVNLGRSYKETKKTLIATFLLLLFVLMFFKTSFIIPRKMIRYFHVHSAVEKVGGHEQLQRDLWLDGEFRDLGGAVGVAHLVREVHADLLKHVRGDLAEVDLVRLVLGELAGAAEHGLDGARGEGVVALHDELVAVRRDEFHVHRLRSLAAAERGRAGPLPGVHGFGHSALGGV